MVLAPAWLWFGAVGLAGVVAFAAADGSAIGQAVAVAIPIATAAAAFAGARRAGRAATPLRLLGAGLLAFGIGDVIFDRAIVAGAAPDVPSLADAWYLLGYPPIAAALLGIARLREGDNESATAIDATVLALGATSAIWLFLIDPGLAAAGASTGERILLTVYPLADLVLFALSCRLLLGGGWRNSVALGFVAGIVMLLAADLIYGFDRLYRDWIPGSLSDVLFLLSYVALGTVALHPGLREVLRPVGAPAQPLTRRRVALLAGAALVGPILIAAESLAALRVNDLVVAVTSALITLLVIARVASLGLRLERALGRSRVNEDRLRRALAAANMATWEWDRETGTVIRSEGMARLYGMDPAADDTDPDRYVPAIHPDDLPAFRAADLAFEPGRGPYVVEYRVVLPDGTIHWLRERGEAGAGEDGATTRMRGVTQDITERKQWELSLAAAETRWKTLVEQLPAAVYIHPVDGLFDATYVSPAIVAMTGYTPEEVTSNPAFILTLVHPDDVPAIEEASERSEREDVFAAVYRVRAKDGRWIWLRDSAVLVRGADRVPSHWQGVFIDITSLKEARELLRLRDLAVAATADGIAIADPTRPGNPIVDVNPAFERITGYPAAEAIGQSLRLLDGPDTDPAERARIEAALSTGADAAATVIAYRKDGRTFWNDLRIAAIEDDRGRPTHVVVALTDVSERVRAEAAMREARDAAEDANRLKSEFLSTMSHELRTPMNAIIGYAHLLLEGLDGDLTPEQSADIGHIARGGDHLLALIDDVLDLSRIEAGRFDLSQERIDVAALIELVRADIAPLAAAKGLAIEIVVAPDLPEVVGDAGRLRQVVLNLAANAVKFTERGGVSLTATANGHEVRIAVEDTGIGIAPDALPHIFDEFRQADGSTSRRYGGSGLGLAIARKLADLHGGRIEVASEPGGGSVFTLVLPSIPSAKSA